MSDHFLGPCLCTSCSTVSSSSLLHGPLTSSGLSTFCHLCRHCTSVRPSSPSATFFQFLPLYCTTSAASRLSSSSVHFPRPFSSRSIGVMNCMCACVPRNIPFVAIIAGKISRYAAPVGYLEAAACAEQCTAAGEHNSRRGVGGHRLRKPGKYKLLQLLH